MSLIQEAMSASARFEIGLGRIAFRLLEFRRRAQIETTPENRRTIVTADIYIELASSDLWEASSACSAASAAAISAFAGDRDHEELRDAVVEALDQLRWAAFVGPVHLEALVGGTIWPEEEQTSQEQAQSWMRRVWESRSDLAFRVAELEVSVRGNNPA